MLIHLRVPRHNKHQPLFSYMKGREGGVLMRTLLGLPDVYTIFVPYKHLAF